MGALRSLLIPGCWAIADGKFDWDLVERDGAVDLKTPDGTIELLRANEIDDGSFKRKFAPRLMEIKEKGEWHYER